jgi:hypothetical protein
VREGARSYKTIKCKVWRRARGAAAGERPIGERGERASRASDVGSDASCGPDGMEQQQGGRLEALGRARHTRPRMEKVWMRDEAGSQAGYVKRPMGRGEKTR